MFKDIIEKKIIKDLIDLNLKPLLVGGLVRDRIINPNINSKDIDIEVYGDLSYEEILEKLELKGYSCNIVGKHFGVIKVYDRELKEDYDISMPRLEESNGFKHQDFNIKTNGKLEFAKAFKRRDFTMNAIAYDLLNNELVDIYNGIQDIKDKIIRHVDRDSFQEDPLRVYRAIQFASRFNFKINIHTKKLIKEMVENNALDNLPKERIFMEFEKIFLKSEKPSIAFELMKDFGILEKYFPELFKLIGIPQEPNWHPEGDVWIHTMMVIDEMAKTKLESEENRLLYMMTCLCHDLGKPDNTQILENGKITSKGHEVGGVEPTLKFLDRLTNRKDLRTKVVALVELHLQPALLFRAGVKAPAIKRLNNKLIKSNLNLMDLAIISKADMLGRTTENSLKGIVPHYDWIVEKYKELNLGKIVIEPLVKGKHLIDKGLKPSPEFKEILNRCYEYQLDMGIQVVSEMDNYLNKQIDELSKGKEKSRI